MVDSDDHSGDEGEGEYEDEDEEVAVHSSVVDERNRLVQVEALDHCTLSVERSVVVALDHTRVAAYQADNLVVVRSKAAAHVDFHMEDMVAAVDVGAA